MLRFVINLDRSPHRWESIHSQLQTLELSAERVSAVDKLQLESAYLQQIVPPISSSLKYYFPKEISRGEVACFLSHKKCWERLAQSSEDWALILEDDAILSPRAKQYFQCSDWIPDGVQIIQLFVIEAEWKCTVLPEKLMLPSGDCLLRPLVPHFGCVAYFISRKAAIRALALSSLLTAPVDEFLFNFKSPFCREFSAWRLNPACVLHTSEFTSDVQDRAGRFSWKNQLHPKRLFLSFLKKMTVVFLGKKVIFTFK